MEAEVGKSTWLAMYTSVEKKGVVKICLVMLHHQLGCG